jgi:hypothetical protein
MRTTAAAAADSGAVQGEAGDAEDDSRHWGLLTMLQMTKDSEPASTIL